MKHLDSRGAVAAPAEDGPVRHFDKTEIITLTPDERAMPKRTLVAASEESEPRIGHDVVAEFEQVIDCEP